MFPRFIWLAAVCLGLGIPSAASQDSDIFLTETLERTPRTFELPSLLQEISGLAVSGESSVYAHNDEFGIVYQIDLAAARVTSAFALGDPTVKADFEGIAVEGDRIYLVTSKGLLYEAEIGGDRSRVRFNVFDTGAGAHCEVEGLTNGTAPEEFLLLCKQPLHPSFDKKLRIYNWSLVNRNLVQDPWLEVDVSEFGLGGASAGFRPSGLEWDQMQDVLTIISARDRAIIRIDESGSLIERASLDEVRHPQAEGIAILEDGSLIIADEGGRQGRRLRRAGAVHVYRN